MRSSAQTHLTIDALSMASECLRTIAHPFRLRMIQMLLDSEYTVGELAAACEIPSHVASGHLGKLKDRGLLTSDRRGREVYYLIAEEGLAGILACIEKRFGR